MKRHQPDYYLVLGVTPNATANEISHAYRTLLRAHHPDTRIAGGTESAIADAELQKVIAAYEVLRDPARRANYDRDAGYTSSTTIVRMPRRPTAESPPIVAGPVRWHPPRGSATAEGSRP